MRARLVPTNLPQVASEEERRQELAKEMKERQKRAGARRLERLTPSPPVGTKGD